MAPLDLTMATITQGTLPNHAPTSPHWHPSSSLHHVRVHHIPRKFQAGCYMSVLQQPPDACHMPPACSPPAPPRPAQCSPLPTQRSVSPSRACGAAPSWPAPSSWPPAPCAGTDAPGTCTQAPHAGMPPRRYEVRKRSAVRQHVRDKPVECSSSCVSAHDGWAIALWHVHSLPHCLTPWRHRSSPPRRGRHVWSLWRCVHCRRVGGAPHQAQGLQSAPEAIQAAADCTVAQPPSASIPFRGR